MGKFHGVLLCTDFDGTFALPDARISAENAEAVRYFQDNGGLFTFASGRSPDFFDRYTQFRANAPIIAANGTMICRCDTRALIEGYPLSDAICDIMDEIAKLPIAREMFLCDSHRQSYRWARGMGKPSEVFSEIPRPWYKLLAQQDERDTYVMRDYVRERYSGVMQCGRSYPQGLELLMPGAGKGACLNRLREILPDIRLTVSAGDFENDISLIQCADIGYAVANAQPECKSAADRLTVSNVEHAIAKIIEELADEIDETGVRPRFV